MSGLPVDDLFRVQMSDNGVASDGASEISAIEHSLKLRHDE
jgi:hypothetical protein